MPAWMCKHKDSKQNNGKIENHWYNYVLCVSSSVLPKPTLLYITFWQEGKDELSSVNISMGKWIINPPVK